LAPLLIGIALADLLHGLPIDSSEEFTGNFWDLLSPYSVFAGLTLVLLCVLHGATYLSLKTDGELRERAHRLARRSTVVTGAAVLIFGVWTQVVIHHGAFPDFLTVGALLAIVASAWLLGERREGWAFAMTAFAMAATVLTFFTDLYPNVMVSSTDAAYNLTVQNASSAPYALKVMTIVAVIFLPVVMIYQGWTYHVFRKRLASLSPAPGAAREAVAAFSRALEEAAGPPADAEETFEEHEAAPTNLRRIAAGLGRYERTVESADAAPTPDAESALAHRREEAAAGLAHWRASLDRDLAAVNAALRAAGLPVLGTNGVSGTEE